jgi:3-hydroxyisobutyrate dehydrogenase-like beta-hydroxyacid dehydrogenase
MTCGRFKRMVNGEFEGGFKLSLARKDIANAIALGDGVPMPISKLVHELMLANSACDDLDMSSMCRLFGISSSHCTGQNGKVMTRI